MKLLKETHYKGSPAIPYIFWEYMIQDELGLSNSWINDICENTKHIHNDKTNEDLYDYDKYLIIVKTIDNNNYIISVYEK